MTESFCDLLVRRRRGLFAIWWAHIWLVHYFVLGFMGWDGFGYRTVPIVELLKHGSIGADRIADWSLVGYTPFVELAHLPFLALFGTRGLMFGFPLVVFPLCVLAIFACVRELTSSERAATFGAIAYCAMPMINQQPFTGYIDFAVAGLLAYFVYALLRIRRGGRAAFGHLVAATVMFTLSRAQGFYVTALMFPLLSYALFRGARRTFLIALAAVALGCIPSLGIQAYKWITFGSPIAPAKLEILGLSIGTGAPMSAYWQYAGLPDGAWSTLLVSAVHGWILHPIWPLGGFYASGSMGTGLMFPIAVALLPGYLPRSTREERWLLCVGLLVSLLSRDFALPRYSYTTVLAVALICGRAIPALLETRARWAFAIVCVLVGLHSFRPELDLLQLRSGFISPRMNAGRSPFYARGGNVFVYPDGGHHFVIVDMMKLPLPIYGARLSNEVVGSIPAGELGAHCEGLARFPADVLVVDEPDATASCTRECVIHEIARCGAWRITPGR